MFPMANWLLTNRDYSIEKQVIKKYGYVNVDTKNIYVCKADE